MHVALLFPPATDPRSPHLAIPSLAAFLRAAGVRVSVHDLDLAGLLHTIQPDRVAAAVQGCDRALTTESDGPRREALRTALAVGDFVADHVGAAPGVLRDLEAFLDPHRYHVARETINHALKLVSLAHGTVDYNTGPIRYHVTGCHAGKLRDLERVTADPSANLFADLYHDTLLPELDRDRPDVVGLSILNGQQIVPGLTLARLLKERGHTVVIGGTVFAKFASELQRRPRFLELFADAVVVYEGETALLDIVERVSHGVALAGAPNTIALDSSGRVVLGPVHVEDVKSLPTPDFDGLPLHDYLAPVPVLPILTGKGCYFNRCKFCDIPSINSVSKKAYRLRSPELVAADVAALHHKYGTRFFDITDEALAPNLLLRIGEALEQHPDVDPRFVGYARLEPAFTPEVCERIHAMGMRKLFFGLESGSQVVLDHMDKGITIDVAKQVLRNCTSAGIAFHLFSIVGFPEETEAQARETLQFFLDNPDIVDQPDASFDIHPFTLDLRTEYYDKGEDFGVVVDLPSMSAVDFALDAERWSNTRGLDEHRAHELIGEFHERLRDALPTWRRFPAHLWPSFEEYSIVYADAFEGRPFDFRMTLPPTGTPTTVRLRWSMSTYLQPVDGGVMAWSLMGSCFIPGPALALLEVERQPLTVDALLDALAVDALERGGHDPETERERYAALVVRFRQMIDLFLSNGVLFLEPTSADAVAITDARVSTTDSPVAVLR